MPLDAAQLRSAFELASVIYQDFTTASISDGFGLQIQIIQLDTLQSALNTYLTTLSADSVIKVAEIISEWDAIVDLPGEMRGGSVGSITGLNFSMDDARARLIKRFQTYVPVLHIADAEARKQNAPTAAQTNNSFRILI
jgi:hypothetical protein